MCLLFAKDVEIRVSNKLKLRIFVFFFRFRRDVPFSGARKTKTSQKKMIKCVCVRPFEHRGSVRLVRGQQESSAGKTPPPCYRASEGDDQRKTAKQLIHGLINRTTLANSTTAAASAASGHYAHVLSAHFNCTRAAAAAAEGLFMTTWPTKQHGPTRNCERARD